jgi:hypothetical protein
MLFLEEGDGGRRVVYGVIVKNRLFSPRKYFSTASTKNAKKS